MTLPGRLRTAWAEVRGWLRKYPFAPRYPRRDRHRVRTSDGVTLRVAHLAGPAGPPGRALPPGTTVRPRYVVVLVHGFANSSRHPRVHAFAHELARRVPVVVPDLRGHGGSDGETTLGLREPLDVAAAVQLAAVLHPDTPVVTVGTSLGGIAVLRHAGSIGGIAGTVAISAPAWWGVNDRPSSARLHEVLATLTGRLLLRTLFATRVPSRFDGVPDAGPVIGAIAPAFTLVVHDPDDAYFGPQHAVQLHQWAGEPKAMWLAPGIGHGIDVLTPAFAARLLDALDGLVSASPGVPVVPAGV